MRRGLVLVVGLAVVFTACGAREATLEQPTATSATSTTPSTTRSAPSSAPDGDAITDTPSPGRSTADPADGGVPDADATAWARREWSVPHDVDPYDVVWGDSGLVLLGYSSEGYDDSPVANGLWHFDGETWTRTLLQDVTTANEYGFGPDVTDLVWFGGRYLAFLMGDETTTPGRASMLVSQDGLRWDLEYIGSAPGAGLPAGFFATPESPPYPGTSAISRVAVHENEITAVGWTVPSSGDDFISVPTVWRSPDGCNWSTTPLPNSNFDNEWASDVAVGPLGYLVSVSGPVHRSAWMWYSSDGVDWTYVGDRFDDQWRMLVATAVGDHAMLALTMDLETDGEPLSLWRSLDGTQWNEVDLPFADVQYAAGWYLADIVGDRNRILALAGIDGETHIWQTKDGLNWSQLPSVTVPTGEPLTRTYPMSLDSVVAGGEGALIAVLPEKVIRWTQSTETRNVVLVASDDVLNVRSGPGVANDVIGSLPPTTRDVTLTGRRSLVGSSTWVEITTDPAAGWVNGYYLAEQDSAAVPFTDSFAVALVDDLAAVFAGRGDLTDIASRHGIVVAHHAPIRRFESLETLLVDPKLHMWAGTGCSPEECPAETPQRTFAEGVADSFLSAWMDDDRLVAIDQVLPGGNRSLSANIVPVEFANLHFVAVKDPGDNPDYDGIDWFTWYVYFAYEDGNPVLLGMSIDEWAP